MSKLKRILAWKPNWSKRRRGGRWYKYVDGTIRYFGQATSKTDTSAYRQAEQRYLDFMRQLEAHQTIEVPVADATVADIGEKYLQNLEQRCQRGDVTPMYVDKTRLALNRFTLAVGMDKKMNCLGEMDVEDFKSHLLSLPVSTRTGRKITAHHAKGILTIIRSFIRWSYKMYLLERLPRNLDDLVRMPRMNARVRTFTLEELQTLWRNANERLRCWILLALNCGCGQNEIAEIRMSEVDWENGYIERDRHKTGVRARHKLWPMTLAAIKQQKNPIAQGDDRVFISEDGLPLVWNALVHGKLKKSDSVKNLFWRLQMKTGINDGRCFYCLRKTGATLVEQIDPAATEMYLSHAEPGMKRVYAERDWGRLERALVEMENRLKDVLNMPSETPRPSRFPRRDS